MYKSVADSGDLEMAKKTPLTRDSIIRTLTAELQPLPSVHAFWEAGAAAFNRIDEWSDIDLYIVSTTRRRSQRRSSSSSRP